jgi:hypothetical protein
LSFLIRVCPRKSVTDLIGAIPVFWIDPSAARTPVGRVIVADERGRLVTDPAPDVTLEAGARSMRVGRRDARPVRDGIRYK